MHIGRLLEEKFLLPRCLSPDSLAKALHTSPARINEILQGKTDITADTDLRLCTFFGLEEGYFLKLQIEFSLIKERARLGGDLSKIEPFAATAVKRFVIWISRITSSSTMMENQNQEPLS